MYFDKGEHLGEMHGHEPSSDQNPLKTLEYKPVSIIEIDESQAGVLANNAGFLPEVLRRSNKQAYAVASNDDQVVVLYFYDHAFFLATLVTSSPKAWSGLRRS